MPKTLLRVPVEAISEILDLDLHNAAKQAHVSFDGGDENGSWYVYPFSDASPDQVIALATPVVKDVIIPDARLVRTGPYQVTVKLASATDWLKPAGSIEHPYDRAVRAECRRVSQDPAWVAWWAASGYGGVLRFQEASEAHSTHPWSFVPSENGSGDLFVHAKLPLTILNTERPVRSQVLEIAAANVAEVLRRTADYLNKPVPQAA